ncbi:MAG: hypothetical protein CMD88_02970 [Gammaproteobacteria bacterium]|nr:hypothetical protein [Gammaproteobacteria bacterium]|tara:strand:- start:86104 stop:86469 length:366 start_codon:yes stop_codon:yes gene_type:complete
MELTKDNSNNNNFIKNYENHIVYIGNSVYKKNIIISRRKIDVWNIIGIESLSIDDFSLILDLNPEIVIVGTGDKFLSPNPEILYNLNNNNIGLEYMITESACKTFNVLLSENRNVVAALYL